MRRVKRQGRLGSQTRFAGGVHTEEGFGHVAIESDEAGDGPGRGSAVGLGDGETDALSVDVCSGLVLEGGREGGREEGRMGGRTNQWVCREIESYAN